MLQFLIPIHTVSESNARGHWAKKARRAKEHRGVVAMALRSCALVTGAALDEAVHVVKLTRVAPRELDDDNLRGALKGVRDGVADWLGINDRDRRVRWEYDQRPGGVREYAVEITIGRLR